MAGDTKLAQESMQEHVDQVRLMILSRLGGQ